ncbi:MAG: thiamine pyrophosphate-binding protein [bacterium]
MTGADILVKELKDRGVEFVFTLCGNGLNPLYVACRDAGLRIIDARNEQSASYMADAYGRLTRRVGVCAVSSGVGHTNALIGVINAHFDGAPMLLISGASPQSESDMGKFQELDHIAMVSPLCKYARAVDRPEKIPFYVHEAISKAVSGRPGPVHLTVPIDVLEADVNSDRVIFVRRGGCEVAQCAPGDAGLIREAAELVSESECPVLVAGSGAFYAGAEEAIESFATAASLPVVVPIWDRGAIPRPSKYFMGVVGAASGEPRLLPEADLVVIAGARIDYRVGYARPPGISEGAKIIRIDVDAGELRQGAEPDIGILGDVRSVLGQLTEELKRLGAKPHVGWFEEARRRDREFRARWIESPAPPSPPITGRHIADELRPFLTEDVIFLVDGGNIGQWAHMALCDGYPPNWLTCGASGVVGWGLPGAIAAKLAHPERPVMLLSGDGAFTFTIAELECAVRHRTPFVVVLADDRAWGIVVSGQEKRYGPEGVLASRMGPIRYDLVAEGFGAAGIRVERPEEIGPAVERGLKADRPTVIHVPISTLGPANGW